MAKLSKLNMRDRAQSASEMIVRNRYAEPDDDTGEFPAYLSADGKPCTLSLLGADSKEAESHSNKIKARFQNKIIARSVRNAARKHKSDVEGSIAVTAEDIAAQAESDLEKVIGLTVGWFGFEDDDGNPMAFSVPAVAELYKQEPDIVAQAVEFIEDRSRLFLE